jgi:hypothetical protein
MNTNECKTIRRELDEAETNQPLSSRAAEHLQGCAECRSFDSDQRTLHGLMASLEPVAAPPDFDFRLRARIAREKSRARSSTGLGNFLKIPRPVAALALVLLIAVAGIVVRNWMTSSSTTAVVGTPPRKDAPLRETGANPIDTGTKNSGTGTLAISAVPSNKPPSQDGHSGTANKATRGTQVVARKGEGTATREYSVTPAAVLDVNQADSAGSIIRVPLDGRALQILIDDGRGATRTISLPTVSFGSQRLMSSQSFMPPVSPTKGVW